MSAGAPLPQYALHAVRTFPMCSAPSTDVGCEFALVHVASCFSAFTTSTVTRGCSTCVGWRCSRSLRYSSQPASTRTHTCTHVALWQLALAGRPYRAESGRPGVLHCKAGVLTSPGRTRPLSSCQRRLADASQRARSILATRPASAHPNAAHCPTWMSASQRRDDGRPS